jgi:succinate-acetate transporter protein
MAAYLALWRLFTFILFIGSLKMSRALQFVLGTLALVFFLEALGQQQVQACLRYSPSILVSSAV